MIVEKIMAAKEMLNTLHRSNWKDGLRASLEFVRPDPLQAQGYRRKNFFEKRSWEHSACSGGPRKLFHQA